MNRVLNIYTELDSVFDSRRGILQFLATKDYDGTNKAFSDERKLAADKLWNTYLKKTYDERRMDTFVYPDLKIDRQAFDRLYKQRKLEHFLMYYPTSLMKDLFKVIIDLEQLNNRPLDIKSATVYLNTFPYELNDELKQELIAQVTKGLLGRFTVKLVSEDPKLLTSAYYRQYNYVFKYDLLTGEDSKALMESLKKLPIPDVRFVVPDILVKDVETFTGSISDRIFALGVALGTTLQLMPVNHALYDYQK